MNKYLIFATQKGLIKKTSIEEYQAIRQSGLVAIKLDSTDKLLNVIPTTGDDQILMITQKGKSIVFHEKEVRPTGRATMGVRGILLKGEDKVIGMDVISKTDEKKADKYEVLVISENGYGKKSKLSEYSQQGRGGQGVFTAKTSSRTGNLVAMRVLRHNHEVHEVKEDGTDSHDLLVVSKKGQTIRLSLEEVPTLGRHTQGVRILKLNSGDKATALTVL